MQTRSRLLVIGLLLAGFIGLIWQVLQTDAQPRIKRPPAQAPVVQVMTAEPADHPVWIETFGVIQAAQVLSIRPQVGGQIVHMHPNFVPGGRIPAGDILYKIDPSNYQLAVKAAEASIAQMRAEIAIEQGKRKAAGQELKLLQDSIKLNAQSRALALREPQKQQARAKLMQAQNQLQQAQLDLQRTQAKLPYDAVVLKRERVAGEVVAALDTLGQMARADQYWIHLRVPLHLMDRIQTRTGDNAGSKVRLEQATQVYEAEVIQIGAELDAEMRMAEVIAEITHPNANQTLLIGSHINARIEAGVLPNTIALPRSAWHDNQRIWLVDAKNTLQVRQIKPVHNDADTIYIAPLQPGERVFLGNPNGLLPGTKVRVKEAEF